MGYTPLTDSSKHYNTWYHVALKIREFDFVGEVCFGVVTSEDLAIDLGVNSVPSARLMLWNDTKVSTIIPTFVLPKKNFIQNELPKFNSGYIIKQICNRNRVQQFLMSYGIQ